MSEDKNETYTLVTSAIREHGAEKVRAIVYGDNGEAMVRYESVAISNFIKSRMFKDDILLKIKSLK